MPGVDPQVIVQKLNVLSEAKMVKQKKRKFAPQVVEAIRQEEAKLLSAGFIREVNYPDWVSNVVMGKKANKKWRMCIDFTNLNKTCPKDSFPLPSIEVMPFSLKNARATYQILNRQDEDDHVQNLQSGSMEDHVQNLSEAFAVLRAHNMKLNLEKYAFGVQAGRFLGFMISKRGIEMNLEKIRVILEMPPSRIIKDIQCLISKFVALNRFITRTADKCLPFFKAAFEELKLYLTSPLLLNSPRVEKPSIYIRLPRKRQFQSKACFPISKVLHQQGTLERRTEVLKNRKCIFTLIVVARKLRQYF
ncbi:Retrovirus-related Pol polyprotein from transposon 17.6 [Gossypium australe]|uniref:Retrovirus-related Pol polyprotein from transposon 17.6 n=1 Tax=Gossypium australe TaxID=47621 RepID=A0A5B6VVW2_9ROSI|nr:Retrovirus-related Pol polyprotein from transposon 17.6 [Gossypium australe]